MSFPWSGWTADEDELQARLRRLNHEVSMLSRIVARRGSRTVEGAREGLSEVVSDLSDRVAELAPVVRKQGAAAGKAARAAAREHPAAAAVAGVVVVGLVLSLLLHRRS